MPHHWDFQVDNASHEPMHSVYVLLFCTNRWPDVNIFGNDNHLCRLKQIFTADPRHGIKLIQLPLKPADFSCNLGAVHGP